MGGRKARPGAEARSGTAKPKQDRGRPTSRLHASPVITHTEVASRLDQGGCLRGVVLEAQKDDAHPDYAIFLLSSWRKEYTVLGFNSAERPRLFRDLDRVLRLVRIDYEFKGTVALRLATDAPPRQHSWRITHGANIARSAPPIPSTPSLKAEDPNART